MMKCQNFGKIRVSSVFPFLFCKYAKIVTWWNEWVKMFVPGLLEYDRTQFWSKNVKIYQNENDFNILWGSAIVGHFEKVCDGKNFCWTLWICVNKYLLQFLSNSKYFLMFKVLSNFTYFYHFSTIWWVFYGIKNA